jgi:Na+/melibiose symporter-like transporter
VVLGLVILKDHRAENAPKSFDILGILLLSGAMFSLIWPLIKAGEWGWGSAGTLGWLAGSVVLFGLFAFWESKVDEPLVPLAMFRSVPLSAGVVLMVLMAFAFMGGLFFVTFFLQGVQEMSPVDSGLRLLPLTGMMIVSSPLAGALITKFGPRVPLVGGMVCTAAAMFGMTTLSEGTGTFAMSLWFALLGLGLAPVMVGATEVIVGNAPMELSGVAGGLQQAAMQVGGALGTAVLGAVMSAKVSAEFADNWKAAGIPAPPDPRLEQAAEFGTVPGELAQAPGMTPELVTTIGDVIHDTFMSGMGLAFTVAGIVAVVAALVAVLTKRGENAEAGAGAAHI